MKKIMPALLLACTLFACKKNTSSDDGQSSDGPKYPVSFSLSDFIITSQNMRVATDSSLTKITNIYYYSFGSDNIRRSLITQDTAHNKTGFGIIKDTLPAGTYTIVVCATTAPVTISGAGSTDLTSNVLFGDLTNSQMNWIPEIFYKKIQITVNPSGNAQQDVTLNRITGKINVLAYDALPATDPNGEVRIAMSQVKRSFSFNTGLVGTENFNYVDAYGTRLSQTTLEANVLGSSSIYNSFWIHILYKDNTGANKDKYFQDIILPANKRIDIKGYLYGIPDTTKGNYNIKISSPYSDSASYSLN